MNWKFKKIKKHCLSSSNLNLSLTYTSSKRQSQDLTACLSDTKVFFLSPYTIFLLLLILWTQIPICNPYLCRDTLHQVWITRTFCVSHLRPSTLNANQAAFLVPFTQAHAQNLALHIFHNAKGQDQKHFFLLKVKSRDI